MLSTPSDYAQSSGRGSTGSSNSSRRRRRKKRNEVTDFQMFLIDGINNDYIAPEKIEAPGCPKRFVLIVKRRQQYKVKVKIASGAWEPEVNSYRWYHVELLIDGQHIRRWFIPKPPDGGNVEHTFDADPLGRPFFFDTRHDGSNGPKDQVEDSDEVGQICVRFRRAKTFSLAEREFSRRKRPRRNHDFHKDNKFNLREAQKKRMDLDTKLKKSTMRTIFGDSNDSYHHHPRNRRSGGLPPAKVIDEEDIVAECSTMYDSAEAFERRNWISPVVQTQFRKYYVNRNWAVEVHAYNENRNVDHGVCDLTGGTEIWKDSQRSDVKDEIVLD